MDNWYVLRKGTDDPEGPYGPEQLRGLLASGKLSEDARVNRAGTDDWIALREVVSTTSGAQSAAAPQPQSRTPARGPVLTYVALALSALLVISVGVATYLVIGTLDRLEHERRAASEEARQDDIRRAQAEREAELAERRGRLVSIEETTNDCYANNQVVTCYLTNLSHETLVACMQGLVMQKESAGVRLYSMPACSGPVAPLATIEVSAPWLGGRPADLCNDVRGYLDWDKCDFKVINHDPKKK